jgi:hypothetical protein
MNLVSLLVHRTINEGSCSPIENLLSRADVINASSRSPEKAEVLCPEAGVSAFGSKLAASSSKKILSSEASTKSILNGASGCSLLLMSICSDGLGFLEEDSDVGDVSVEVLFLLLLLLLLLLLQLCGFQDAVYSHFVP